MRVNSSGAWGALLVAACVGCAATSATSATTAGAQAAPQAASQAASRSAPRAWEPARDARFLAASGVLLAVALPLDGRLRAAALAHRSHFADRVAADVDPLGRAGDVLPALAAAVVLPRLAGRRGLSDAALRVGLSYLATDAVESVLKPAVGRHRPSDGRGPLRFAPFRNDEAWHSFPSAHVAHAFGVAAALSVEARRPWVSGLAYGAAALVGAQRVYRNAHWTSDVVATAALATATSAGTDAWLRRRGLAHLLRPAGDGAAVGVGAAGGTVSVRWTFR